MRLMLLLRGGLVFEKKCALEGRNTEHRTVEEGAGCQLQLPQ
jgi:hypothetical protein